MKMYKYLILVILGIVFSCTTDNTFNPPNTGHLLVGDLSANASLTSTVEMLYMLYDPEHRVTQKFEFDLDNDGIDDFKFDIASSPSWTSGFEVVRLQSLHTNALFMSNDSIVSPEILDIGDTISIMNNAIVNASDEYGARLHYYSRTGPPFGEQIITRFGLWNGADHKHVGLMVKKSNVIIYGWAEISIDGEGMYIHKIASNSSFY